ncbi:asparagine synthase [Marinilabilia salmonicolor]|uniref:asparagine synthase-related protein n=1 Tax=Marinilabilia salmonicolor TaxID=989 RepID=UPI000D46E765|nr:asparagine synthase-related protein [Marinilabilia salmonicolor]PRY97378.1 asparagine synthase [Marinilabilia salmonicolor]
MINNPVIPVEPVYYKVPGTHELDLEAITAFAAIGFFLGRDTYWKDIKVLPPATSYSINSDQQVVPGEAYFKWFYAPRDISFNETIEEFTFLFEKITNEQTSGKRIILPLSGGLDSRSQAAALASLRHPNVASYSYKFSNSFDETGYGRKIANQCGFSFKDLKIPIGYLWSRIEELAEINDCFSEFTHPRQMGVIDEIGELGDLFFLGHWGDVLFDDMKLRDSATETEQLIHLKKKIVKKGGRELADSLWRVWGLDGDFEEYLDARLLDLLRTIDIKNANAKIRAFKSLFWAPRWTSVNLGVFSSRRPVALPYYDKRMCDFICRVPEKYLAGRQIQIEYIKRASPELAAIPWQTYDPANLFTYQEFHHIKYLPKRIIRKGKRILNEKLRGKHLVQRNWENQFLGKENKKSLDRWLLKNKTYSDFIPVSVTNDFLDRFKNGESLYFSHPVSMLLTLSLFSKRHL